MENITVCILNMDTAYTQALIRSVAATYAGFRFFVFEDYNFEDFDSEEFSAEYSGSEDFDAVDPGRSNALYDVYLLSTDTLERGLPHRIIDRAIVLYDAFLEYPPEGLSAVDMYGNCSTMVSFILSKYAKSTGRPSPQHAHFGAEAGRTPQFLSFMSLEGGAGTSSIAIAVARELSRFRDRNTMYVSLEPYESPAYWEPMDRTRTWDEDIPECMREYALPQQLDLNDYVYCFLRRNNGGDLIRHREAALLYDSCGVAHFRTTCGFNILTEFAAEELIAFFEGLARDSGLDHIILDWGVRLDHVVRDFLQYAPDAVFVRSDGSVKNSYYIKTMTEIGASFGLDAGGLIFVTNKVREEAEAYGTSTYREGAAEDSDRFARVDIPNDVDSFRCHEHGVEMSLSGAFGMGVKELADEILGVRKDAAK